MGGLRVALTAALVSLTPIGRLAAQEGDTTPSEVTSQLWTYFVYNRDPRSRWQQFGDGAYKLQLSSGTWMRWQAAPSIRYLATRAIDVRGGLGLYYTLQDGPDQTELRPYQGAKLIWPTLRKFELSHLARLEERLVFQPGADPDFGLRIRYRVGTVLPLGSLIERVTGYNRISIPLSLELFIDPADVEERFASTVQLLAGLAYIIDRDWSVDLSVIVERSEDTQTGGFDTTNLIVRIDLRHRQPAIAR